MKLKISVGDLSRDAKWSARAGLLRVGIAWLASEMIAAPTLARAAILALCVPRAQHPSRISLLCADDGKLPAQFLAPPEPADEDVICTLSHLEMMALSAAFPKKERPGTGGGEHMRFAYHIYTHLTLAACKLLQRTFVWLLAKMIP